MRRRSLISWACRLLCIGTCSILLTFWILSAFVEAEYIQLRNEVSYANGQLRVRWTGAGPGGALISGSSVEIENWLEARHVRYLGWTQHAADSWTDRFGLR